MSLLMEALKKAEEAKRQSSDNRQASVPSMAASPLGETAAASDSDRIATLADRQPPPDMSTPFNAEDIGIKPAPPRAINRPTDTATEGNRAAERTAVRNVFSAKQPPGKNNNLWLVAGLGLFAALAVGGYFWWQLQAIPAHTLAKPLPPAPATAAAAASASPSPASPIAGALANPTPSLQPSPAPPSEELKSPANRLSAKPSASSVAAERKEKPTAPPADSMAQAPVDGPVRLSRSQPRADPALERGYDALQAGRLDDAQRDYEQVLRNDPKNTDALLGLATIAGQQGQAERAQRYYLRALESNPNDATAQAGVISTRGLADADFSESRLKTALSSQPDSPALLFALGNLYASQGRWSEAQQVYFRAYATEPDNPDFIFNLAVSLDHLRQNKLAGQYYQMALTAGESRTVSFDRNQARTRILELQP